MIIINKGIDIFVQRREDKEFTLESSFHTRSIESRWVEVCFSLHLIAIRTVVRAVHWTISCFLVAKNCSRGHYCNHCRVCCAFSLRLCLLWYFCLLREISQCHVGYVMVVQVSGKCYSSWFSWRGWASKFHNMVFVELEWYAYGWQRKQCERSFCSFACKTTFAPIIQIAELKFSISNMIMWHRKQGLIRPVQRLSFIAHVHHGAAGDEDKTRISSVAMNNFNDFLKKLGGTGVSGIDVLRVFQK